MSPGTENRSSNDMQNDWDNFHYQQPVKAVMGHDMEMVDFRKSGETQFIDRIAPALEAYLGRPFSDCVCLEIGCGPGRLLRPLAKRFKRVVGYDVSRKAVELARNELAGLENVEIILGNGSDLEGVSGASIDAVVSFDVFQHIPTEEIQKSYLREVARVLKPGGVFAIQVKTTSGWMKIGSIPVIPRALRGLIPDSLLDSYLRLAGRRETRLKKTWRGSLIRHSGLRSFFEDAGLRVQSVRLDGKSPRWLVVGEKPKVS